MTKENRKTIIDALYNRCANGEISLEQRELLIRKVNSLHDITESCDIENVSEEMNIDTDDELISSSQKYEMFKDAVYRKCKNGDITLDMREKLLQKARDKFYPSV